MTKDILEINERDLKIFAGNSHKELAQEICDYIGIPLGNATVESFPDGETFVQFHDSIRGDDVFIVQSTDKPANENIMELLIMIDAARRASAGRITAVIPFYGYARQDRKDKGRVPITAKLVANLLVAAGANRVLTMDLHAQQIAGFFDIPVDHLLAVQVFERYLRQQNLSELTIVSPDVGGMKMADVYVKLLGCKLGLVYKRRLGAENVQAVHVIGDIEGRNVLLVDDITESAGTLIAAAEILKARGAKKIMAAVSHGVLSSVGYQRLKDNPILDEIITTNSTQVNPPEGLHTKINVLSIAHLFGDAIKRIHGNLSVSGLFKIKGF